MSNHQFEQAGYITTRQAAEALGISRTALYGLERRDEIKIVRAISPSGARQNYVHKSDVENAKAARAERERLEFEAAIKSAGSSAT